ncbi:MAG TPA: hypoxanthine phosphoribosyltransferase [Cyclobacteriaceae bacterium]|jgi:hypoxanthine phosphoribosyltransferase
MKLHDLEFELYLKSDKIQEKVIELAKRINKDYRNISPLFVPILNGSFMFAGDLLKLIKLECLVSFIKVSSYSELESSGNLKQLIGVNEKIFGRDVIIIEDIIDSGKTMTELLEKFLELGPNSLEVVSLFRKEKAKQYDMNIKYIGFEIPNDFIVGYGLDYNGYGRNLKDIYKLKSDE